MEESEMGKITRNKAKGKCMCQEVWKNATLQ
jgi:hypothetical protein